MRLSAAVAPPGSATFNVRTYGAVGNGVKDDTVAIQAAITAAANLLQANSTPYFGAVVFFPTGNYKVTGTLVINLGGSGASLTLLGEGGRGFGAPQAGISVLSMSNVNVDTVQVTGAAATTVSFCGLVFSYTGGTLGSAINAAPIGFGLGTLQVTDCGFFRPPASAIKAAGAAIDVDNVAVVDFGRAVAGAHGVDGGAAGGQITVLGSSITTTIAAAGDCVNGVSGAPLQVIGNVFYSLTGTNGVDCGSASGVVADNVFLSGTVHASSTPILLSVHDNKVTSTMAGVTGSSGIYVHHNRGYNPVGHGVAQPAVPASTVAASNTTGVDCTVHVAGGTVTAIAISGVATGLTAGTFRVPCGASIAITYTLVPTWQWFGD